jgi:Tfp pilus assembly protein PilO
MAEGTEVLGGRNEPREPQFKRFTDRVLLSACGLVMALVGLVWALTWRGSEAKIQEATQRLNASDATQKQHAERIIKLEVLQDQAERHLQSIDTKQSVIEGKIDSTQGSLNQVLIEIRKK